MGSDGVAADVAVVVVVPADADADAGADVVFLAAAVAAAAAVTGEGTVGAQLPDNLDMPFRLAQHTMVGRSQTQRWFDGKGHSSQAVYCERWPGDDGSEDFAAALDANGERSVPVVVSAVVPSHDGHIVDDTGQDALRHGGAGASSRDELRPQTIF